MVFSTLLSLVAATAVSALPIQERQSPDALTDPDILNFALTLEHLEATFYSEAMSNYSESAFEAAGFGGGVRERIQEIAADEAQHVSFLTTALKAAGASPVGASKYIFPSTDVKSFLGLSQILEGVGVSAYLGAAPDIMNKAYLSAAGSILTVEARHNAFIRDTNGKSPFPSPEDGALTPRDVVTLASVFFAPGAPNAPTIKPFPALMVSASKPYAGETVMAKPASKSNSSTVYCAFVSGLETGFSTWKDDACKIPTQNVTYGQTYVLLTNAMSLSDATTLAGPGIVDISKKM